MGRFVKGQSGNPGGRPKAVKEVIEAAQLEGVASVEALVRIRDDADDPHAVIAAAKALLERGYGKPFQPLTGADGGAIETAAKVIILPDNGRG